MKSFAEVEKAVNSYAMSLDRSSSYSLERIIALLEALGNPQEKFKTVHIAGTSGKTSTSYYTAAMLEKAGYKVGLSVSPYVNDMNERVQIGTEPLPETLFCQEFSQFFEILNKLSIRPTYFELFVSFAYWYFAKAGVEYAVMEVGLGGLLDGTNVIRREDKVCIITDIGLDHISVLGGTIKEVAAQKAGIIQPHNHVFIYRQSSEIDTQIQARAREKHAIIHYADAKPAQECLQRRNWNLAQTACEYILDRDGKERPASEAWLQTAYITIPGRQETLKYKEKTIILDGAHNAQKTDFLVESFRARYPDESPAVLLAIGANKDIHVQGMAQSLGILANFTIITTFSKGGDTPYPSIDPEEIAKYFDEQCVTVEPDLQRAIEALLAREEKILLVTGSLYLVGAVKKLLKDIFLE